MLDSGRHFWTVDEVKEFIDILAMHKMNRFHWHLTEDQGWRIEIKRYPELTRVGSVRKETLVGHLTTSSEYDRTPYGGYYTQSEIRDIVAYAAERYITVIPEIELPGHAVAALASYPLAGMPGRRLRGPYDLGHQFRCLLPGQGDHVRVSTKRPRRGDRALPVEIHPHRR